MKVGIPLTGLDLRDYPEVASVAESHGFDAVWTSEHLVYPAKPLVLPGKYKYPPIDSGSPAFDPWVVLSAVASRTKSILLGTGVHVFPLRHPIMVGRSVITVDRLSGGRVLCGLGVGWLRDEFEIVGQSFHNRGRRTDEMIALIRQLWSDDVIEFHGEFYDVPPVKFEPKPVDRAQGIPMIVGGTSPRALRRAAELGDGWMDAETDEDDWERVKGDIATLNRHRREAGREQEEFEVIASMGSAPDVLRRAEEAGITMCNVSPWPRNAQAKRDEFIEFIQRFADDVLSNR